MRQKNYHFILQKRDGSAVFGEFICFVFFIFFMISLFEKNISLFFVPTA